MRVGIVYFPKSSNSSLIDVSRALAEGISSQGHQVDLIDGVRDSNVKLTVYSYIAVGAESLNFFGGRVSDKIPAFLGNSGLVRGKRSYAFTLKKNLRPLKTLNRLMQIMEHEGMYLKKSDIISSKDQAVLVGRKLHVS